jgi:thymidine kinase
MSQEEDEQQINYSGQIELISGPMKAGKTEELIRRLQRYNAVHKRCVLIKYANDVRYRESSRSSNNNTYTTGISNAIGGLLPAELLEASTNEELVVAGDSYASSHESRMVYTHNGKSYAGIAVLDLGEVDEQVLDEVDVIGIDEGQFFNEIAVFAEHHANRGKIVLIAALDGTYERKCWSTIVPLYSLAEKVTKLTAICDHCRKSKGVFSRRIVPDQQVQLIGGDDKYRSLCRRCFFLPLPLHEYGYGAQMDTNCPTGSSLMQGQNVGQQQQQQPSTRTEEGGPLSANNKRRADNNEPPVIAVPAASPLQSNKRLRVVAGEGEGANAAIRLYHRLPLNACSDNVMIEAQPSSSSNNHLPLSGPKTPPYAIVGFTGGAPKRKPTL